MKAVSCYVLRYGVSSKVLVTYVFFFLCLNFCFGVVRPDHTGYMGEQYDQHRMDALSKYAVIVVRTTLVVETR